MDNFDSIFSHARLLGNDLVYMSFKDIPIKLRLRIILQFGPLLSVPRSADAPNSRPEFGSPRIPRGLSAGFTVDKAQVGLLCTLVTEWSRTQ